MSNGNGSSSRSITASAEEDPDTPLWKFVTKLEKISGNGGNWLFQCSYCDSKFRGSYSRVKAHLLEIANQGIKVCDKVSKEERSKLKKLHRQSEKRAKAKSAIREENEKIRSEPRKRRALEKKAIYDQHKAVLDSLIANCFYSQGISFNMARNPYYLESFKYAASHDISGYTPPSYNDLRTTLLDREKFNIEYQFGPVRFRWGEKGVTIVCSGFSDVETRPLVNFFAVSDSVLMFLKAVNCEGLVMSKHQIVSLVRSIILEVGAKNVVQVVTENIPECEAAGRIIEEEFGNVYWSSCVVHTLDLVLKDICVNKITELGEVAHQQCQLIREVISDVLLTRDYILSLPMHDILLKKVPSLKMLTLAETRFASHVVMLRRLREIRMSLRTVMDDDAWFCYAESDDDMAKAKYIKGKIMTDDWWDFVDFIISFTEPIYEMMRVCDTVEPTLHLVCDYWDNMIEKVRERMHSYEKLEDFDVSEFYDVVHNMLVSRWGKSHAPLHCLVHSLNPRYYSREWLEGGQGRVAPHMDPAISKERDNCLKRYFPDTEARYNVISQFGDFAGCAGHFVSLDSQIGRGRMDARQWWVVYGVGAPQLQTLALKLLDHPTSSSCCEKNWSTYSFIHSLDKNPMDPERAMDLVFVHNNLRLLSRRSPQYKQGETKMWDIAGDAFDLSEKGLLEMANLSLDEPEMERMFFLDELGVVDNVLMLTSH